MQPRQRRSKIEKVGIDTLRHVARSGSGHSAASVSPVEGRRAADFDIDSFGFPVVCRVEGVDWLVDGQHRVYAIQKCGQATSTDKIECEVYEGLTMPEMARMFLGRNRSTPVSAFGALRSGSHRGVPDRVGHCRDRVQGGPQDRSCREERQRVSVGALRRVYEREGKEVLERVLCVLRDAYQSSGQAFQARLIDGTALVLGTYAEIDDKTLIRALASEQHGVHGLQRRTEDYRERLGRPVPQCIAASVVDIYNRQVGKETSAHQVVEDAHRGPPALSFQLRKRLGSPREAPPSSPSLRERRPRTHPEGSRNALTAEDLPEKSTLLDDPWISSARLRLDRCPGALPLGGECPGSFSTRHAPARCVFPLGGRRSVDRLWRVR